MALLRLPSTHPTSTSLPSLHKPTSFSFSDSLSILTPTKPKIFPIRVSSSSSSSSSAVVATETPETVVVVVEEVSKSRLVAQNIPWNSTSQDIRALFEKHGSVLDVELSMHNKTRNRGLAFVTMGSPEEALAALNNLESFEYEGRILKINYALPRKQKPVPPPGPPKQVPTDALFVANLAYSVRDKDLKEFFESGASNVMSAEVIYHDNPRRPSGYGFVNFTSKAAAQTALSDFQGKMFMERPIRVAHSKRYLKPTPKESTHSEDASTKLVPDSEGSENTDVV